MSGFYVVRFGGNDYRRMRISGNSSFLDRLEVELLFRGITPVSGWQKEWREKKAFAAVSEEGDKYSIYLGQDGEDIFVVRILFEAVSSSGDDWRVVEMGGLSLVERNQGEHDRRFFPVGGAYLDSLVAVAKCEKLAKGWPYTRFINK
jgi:hypothetical protein